MALVSHPFFFYKKRKFSKLLLTIPKLAGYWPGDKFVVPAPPVSQVQSVGKLDKHSSADLRWVLPGSHQSFTVFRWAVSCHLHTLWLAESLPCSDPNCCVAWPAWPAPGRAPAASFHWSVPVRRPIGASALRLQCYLGPSPWQEYCSVPWGGVLVSGHPRDCSIVPRTSVTYCRALSISVTIYPLRCAITLWH